MDFDHNGALSAGAGGEDSDSFARDNYSEVLVARTQQLISHESEKNDVFLFWNYFLMINN